MNDRCGQNLLSNVRIRLHIEIDNPNTLHISFLTITSTSACTLAIQVMQHVSRSPPHPIFRRTFTLRDCEAANESLMKDYFDPTPDHGPDKQRMDARGYLGFTSIQKVTSALRILAYGNTYDINDEYLNLGEKTTQDSVEQFCFGIYKLYGKHYLKNHTWNDLQQIYEIHLEKHGIPGMIGRWDCRQWRWYNCPTAWRCQYTRGDQKGPALVLQAVASYDLRVCRLSLV
ncbi:putative harbinger transposase-derived protein [Helianthus annuus]|nr:putative harbinger transposase-derived protein [Helianthus annuus]KAJ0459902.1 putative harbinger transposase-derived protein [Helianthus annuus]